jgi:hypothetical protein
MSNSIEENGYRIWKQFSEHPSELYDVGSASITFFDVNNTQVKQTTMNVVYVNGEK